MNNGIGQRIQKQNSATGTSYDQSHKWNQKGNELKVRDLTGQTPQIVDQNEFQMDQPFFILKK
jgi:hypothetical protein